MHHPTLSLRERVSPEATGEGLERHDIGLSTPSSGCFAATFSPWEKVIRAANVGTSS
jgi:hypothetical protein